MKGYRPSQAALQRGGPVVFPGDNDKLAVINEGIDMLIS